MPTVYNSSLYGSPKTPAHLRSVIDQISKIGAGVESRLVIVEGHAGVRSAIFDSTAAAGAILYLAATGNAELADSSAAATAGVAGMATEAVTAAATGDFITDGRVTLADWTAVIGAASLTPGAVYYLSATAGQMTATPPSAGVNVRLGRALTATTFDLEIRPGILL